MVKISDGKPWRSVSLQDTVTGSSYGSSSTPGAISSQKKSKRQNRIFDDPAILQGYESVPLIEVDSLPRGGVSLETAAVGRIQFGIPPETVKDSMLLGMEVPSVYIVPVERFCREIGPVLGINMAEFEFPAYFNYFVRQKRCTLVVDSTDAERDIRHVFEETLLGPEHFRNHQSPCANVDEDFDPNFPNDSRPNFYKEFHHFRTAEKSTDFKELSVSTLLDFVHFYQPSRNNKREDDCLGVPPTPPEYVIEDPRQPSRLSEGRFADHTRKFSFSTSVRDDMFVDLPIEDRPRLRRRNSGSSDSIAASNQSGCRSSDRRNSVDSVETSGVSQKPEGRRSSMPMGENLRSNVVSGAFIPDKDTSGRRDSHMSINSGRSSFSRSGRGSWYSAATFGDDFVTDDDTELQETSWIYSQVRWLGEVATVYPSNVSEEQRSSTTARVEIFKMAGGTEYVIHDIDENNIIIGKARISGTVRVPDELSLEGFTSNESQFGELKGEESDGNNDIDSALNRPKGIAPTFHPPSFGVTVLGNSHGFDKNGSTSGYVLWINGRGIMIDPPPYSSATLEREGIRPQMIMAIIITHCHADHDAGAFQKVMTGSRVAIITTPTIYKSFIRKYSALTGLRATLLRHSHRHRPAIIGQPLRFQGAVFHFTYTLHTIPCISFRVEWRGKSIVFTGDHMNIPSAIDELERKGVLSRGRANDLRRLPIQDCDVLLHEAGAPPIHTPLSVLQALPEKVKERLYVVHTAAIPADCGLRVAPTGTVGTIRLDSAVHDRIQNKLDLDMFLEQIEVREISLQNGTNPKLAPLRDNDTSNPHSLLHRFDGEKGPGNVVPLVFLRPTDVSDAWFILNLLSAVPFLSSLSYAHTMDILEIAQVEVYSSGKIVLEGIRRTEYLCVFWEGTCITKQAFDANKITTVWHAGDWTGPVSLQPDIDRSALATDDEVLPDIIALSDEGVKVILLKMNDVVRILNAGSKLFRTYAALTEDLEEKNDQGTSFKLQDAVERSSEVMAVIQCNSVLRSLTAMQRRCLESLAEGPRVFSSFSAIWKVGDPVGYAYLIVSGTVTMGRKAAPKMTMGKGRRGSTGAISASSLAAIQEMESNSRSNEGLNPVLTVDSDKLLQNVHPNSEYARLESKLRIRAEDVEVCSELIAGFVDDDDKQRFDAIQAHSDKFANKVLARLYSRRAYTEHLVFSRGNFLSDTSRMVSGVLANAEAARSLRSSITGIMGKDNHCHTSNLVAGPQGCVAMVFPRSTLVPFLDSNPGVLLCLLGTQVVV